MKQVREERNFTREVSEAIMENSVSLCRAGTFLQREYPKEHLDLLAENIKALGIVAEQCYSRSMPDTGGKVRRAWQLMCDRRVATASAWPSWLIAPGA